jgi:hypothetical protein
VNLNGRTDDLPGETICLLPLSRHLQILDFIITQFLSPSNQELKLKN